MYASLWRLLRPFAAMNGMLGRHRGRDRPWLRGRPQEGRRVVCLRSLGDRRRRDRHRAGSRRPEPAATVAQSAPRAARCRSRSDAMLRVECEVDRPSPGPGRHRRCYPRTGVSQTAGANFAPVGGLQGQTRTGAEPSPATYIGPGEEPEAKEDEVSDIRSDDRTWVEAVDHYVAGVRRERPRRSPNGRYVLASALVLAVTMSPVAIGATGSVLREGKRNPSSGAAAKETEMISQTKTYGTRQSNIRDGNGGGAIYGCRSSAGREPCIRANNLKNGRAFEFETDGDEGGLHRDEESGCAAVRDQRDGSRGGPERGPGRLAERGEDRLSRQGADARHPDPEPRRADPERLLRGRSEPGRARHRRRCPTP